MLEPQMNSYLLSDEQSLYKRKQQLIIWTVSFSSFLFQELSKIDLKIVLYCFVSARWGKTKNLFVEYLKYGAKFNLFPELH